MAAIALTSDVQRMSQKDDASIATRASLLGTLEPLVTVALAAVILREQPGPGAALGGVLILAGALLAQWPARPTPAAALAGADAAAARMQIGRAHV